MNEVPSQQELEALHCWEPEDRVPGRPEMTEFRRRVRYHDRAKPAIAKPVGRPRQREVAARSGAFTEGAVDGVDRADLLVTSLEHLLLLSMLQHPDGRWSWGRYVVVYPEGNLDLAGMCSRYDALLTDRATFSHATVEELLGAGALPPKTVVALRERYVPG